ncbi:MAG: DUF1848 domain-containing protein [Bacillota bacterium]
MIISASRRTDLPAFYSRWFLNRLKEGFALVRNPFRPSIVTKVSLRREDVDCIVFWTKNPGPMLADLHPLRDFPYYFLFTLNPYAADLEANLPAKPVLVETFRRLAGQIGGRKVIWRYDPIIFTDRTGPDYHRRNFEQLAAALSPYTGKCIISFLDFYAKTRKNTAHLSVFEPDMGLKRETAAAMAEIARGFGLKLETCAEDPDFTGLGIDRAACIDGGLIREITGRDIAFRKDRNQRKACGCAESADIGGYDTCRHCCVYCYANKIPDPRRRVPAHDPDSPLISGWAEAGDVIVEG